MSSGAANQVLMFGAEALLVALLLLGLFRLRSRFGLSPLYVTLGVFQPIQVLLASSIFVEILPGLVISPGSAVMFTATLFAILLVYIREDAVEARKVIYGIVVANLSMTLLMLVFGAQLTLPGTLNLLGLPREVFSQGARVMVTGTLALFADVLLIIFVFEAVWRFIPRALFLRIFFTMAIILAFDTLVFATGAFYGQPHFGSTVLSGIVGKIGMATLYAAVLTLYLRFAEPAESSSSAVRKPFQDIFTVLTYRQKYEIERDGAVRVSQEGEQRFRAIFNATNDAIFVHDLETGAIVDVNQKMCEMFAMTREEALQANVGDLSAAIAPYAQVDALGWMRKAAAGEPQLFEWHARDKTGRLFWVEVNMRRAAIGPDERIIVSVREITDRKLAEEALRRSERVLQLFVEHAPAAIAMFDCDMTYLAASRRFLADYGLGEQDVIGRSHYQVLPEIPERWREIHRRCLAGAIEKAEEDPFPRADGGTDWVRWEIRPWHETQGAIGGLILFSEVITERKRAEDELHKVNEYLLAVNRIIVACASTMNAEEILDKVLDEALRITGLEGGTICYVTPKETLQIAAHRATSEATIEDLTTHAVKIGDCLCGESARDQKPLILADRVAVLKFSRPGRYTPARPGSTRRSRSDRTSSSSISNFPTWTVSRCSRRSAVRRATGRSRSSP